MLLVVMRRPMLVISLLLTQMAIADADAMQGYIDALSYPARIVVKPMNSIVLLDQKISFFCRADGNPIPTVLWKRNGDRISALSRYVVHGQKNGLSTLRIEPVRDADNNTDISCTADNGVGKPVEAKAILSVILPKNLPENFPVIQQHPKLKAVEKNRPAQVVCTVQSPNSSRVLWLRDLLPLDLNDPRYSIATLGNPGSLMIMNSREKDEGKYECVARNGDYVAHSKAAHLYVKVRRVPPHFSIPPNNTYKVGPGGSVDLKCVAVGYPMPKVFWRRGYHETLQDPDNAPVGKNILTLKEVERSENYTCVAVSKLGNIEFLTKVIVKDFPPAPTNLRVSNLTSYSITLEWNPVQVTATEPLKHYTVQYRPKYTDGTDYLESSPTKTTSASITGLEPWQEYEFRVVAENTVGRGPASIPKDVQTSESTPGSAPLNVQARAVSPSSILVQWVPPEKPNGQIENYVVHYTSTRTNPFTAWERKEVQNILMATIHGLEQDTTYFVKVQAKNKKGVGVLSDMATVVTKMGIPGQPTNVKAVPVGPRQVIVSWGQPLHSQKILGYTIQYNNSKDTKVLELQNPSENEFAVDSLKPDTEYTFQVAARSTRGQGTLSRPVNAKTNPSVPSGSPTITELERVGPTSLLVKWEPPSKSLQHGRLKSYRITWTPIFDEDDYIEEEEFVGPATYTVSADKERQYKIDDLDVYTLYRVTVAAGTLKGFGPDSGPMELRTGENDGDTEQKPVPSAPKNVRVDPMDASTVRVSWEPPQRANGELRGYYVYKEELKNGEPIGDRLQKAMVINTPTQRYATIRDLKPNTEYSFRVNAFNRQGDGEFSRVKKIITTGLPPSAPLNVQFSDFHKDPPLRVRISWDPPDRTYGLPIKYYVVRFKAVDDIQFSAKQTTDTFTQINGLLMGKEYEFLVQAVNDDGHSPNATEKLRTPDGVPQAAPQNIRYDYKDKESKTLIVSWDAPPKDQRNGKIVRYETELKNLDESVQGEPIKQDIIISQSTSYIVDPKMPYSFVVKACTEVGCGPPTDTRTFNLRTQVLIKPPTNVRVQSLSTTSVVVQWDQVDDADGYVVYYVHEQQPKNDKNQWYQRSVDGLESDFTIEKLKSDSPYAFCVSSTKDTRTSECSEITIIDKLVPRFMVKDLRVVDISHNEARLEWSYDGGGPVSYYLNYTGYKVYQDIHLKTKDMNFSGVEDATDQTYYHWKYLRPYTTFTFRVGVEIFEKDGGKTRYWPASVSADTLYYSSPFVPAPAPLNSANEHQFTLSLQPASEEYGLISHYWLVIVPNNKTQRPEAIANNMLDRTHSVDKPYITANLTSDRMKEIITQEDGKFIVGTTVAEGGMENKRLDPAKSYRAFVRAFSRRNPKKVGQSYVPTPPPSVDHYGYQADSVMSPTFHSVKSASAKNRRAGNVWLIGPIIAILIMTVIVGMLIIYWMKRNKKKHLPTRRGSISKVALGPTETSKLLMSDGYPPTISMMPPPPNNAIMNPYEPLMTGITMNGTGMGHIMDPMEMHPMSPPYVPVAQTPGMVAHPPIPITELAGHIERLKANDNMLFFQEYESIETGQQFTWEASNLEMNKPKNRYANVVSYDHSRVKLSFFDGMEGSDYINANYIDGYRKPKAYIATQGPLPETFGDFWRMIWEENSVTIVMLTKLEERTRIKCDMYWPNRGSHTYGQIQVTLTDTLDLAHYTIRTLRLQKRGDTEVRDIRHLQFTAWPDHGVPDHPTPFLMFLKRVKSLNPPEAGPIVTHCSAGIGRTGAFIAIDCMLDRLRFENTVDIYGCVTCLRSQRSYMVQTEDQYVFIHDSVLDAIQSGSTEVPANKLYTHIQALMQIQPLDNASGMELEFRHLAALKMLNAHFGAANLPCNKQKNRLVNILPYDSTRVCLCPLPDVPEGSDYLNASWIDGYRKPRSYIATQGPLPSTTEDLWRLLWEHNSCIIVMLTNLREMGREKCFQYWPGDRSERYGSFVVEPIAEYNMPQYVLREFKMTDTQSGQSRTIRHFQYTEWPEQGSPKSGEMFVEFIGQVHKTKEQFGVDGPITVHCSAGVGRTGVFVTLSIVLERMRYENVVDIFTTVKLLRTQRPNMVQSEDQYHFCYQAALEYLGSFDPYTYAPE